MTNKNPFEIRSDILHLAKEYMDTQHQVNIQLASDMFEQGKNNMYDVQEAYEMYPIQDVIDAAKEMYAFVSTKE